MEVLWLTVLRCGERNGDAWSVTSVIVGRQRTTVVSGRCQASQSVSVGWRGREGEREGGGGRGTGEIVAHNRGRGVCGGRPLDLCFSLSNWLHYLHIPWSSRNCGRNGAKFRIHAEKFVCKI